MSVNWFGGADWSAFIVGIASSLIATLIVGLISVFTIFRPLLASARKMLESTLRPVNEIQDVAEFAILLAESLSEFSGDYRRLVMYRALPCEMSPQFLRYCFGAHVSDEALDAINVYERCITSIVREGRGSHDKTIFGRSGIESLDAATRDACLLDYFAGDEAVETTDLGLHDNFNEIGIVLLGETIEERHDDLKQWKAGFIFVFSEDFKTVRGFRHNMHSHIMNLKLLFDERKNDCEKNNMYFSLSHDMNSQAVTALKETTVSFFNAPFSRRFLASHRRQRPTGA
jgi:hypothetical protein